MTEDKDATIARLTAERDAARAEGFAQGIEAAKKVVRSRCPTWPPDGPPNMESQIVNDTLCDAFYAVDELLSPTPQADPVREAAQVLLDACPNPVFDRLKPELMGEFSVPFPMNDEDGDEYFHHVNVPWVVMKEMIRAALRGLAQKGE